MLTFSINSGSNGNCIYVEAGDVRLLFDAGISGRETERRMAAFGRSVRDCTALIISHDHSDHTSCLGVLHRRYGLPVYMSPLVWRQIAPAAGVLHDVRWYWPGNSLHFGDVTVHTIRTPHDGIDTVCFVVEHQGRRLGILTDLGHPFAELAEILAQVDGAYLESNFDTDMLARGPYPDHLKRRITGLGGHLSNDEAADSVLRHAAGRLKWIAAAHLSDSNNHPDLALDAYRRRSALLPVRLAPRFAASELFEV